MRSDLKPPSTFKQVHWTLGRGCILAWLCSTLSDCLGMTHNAVSGAQSGNRDWSRDHGVPEPKVSVFQEGLAGGYSLLCIGRIGNFSSSCDFE